MQGTSILVKISRGPPTSMGMCEFTPTWSLQCFVFFFNWPTSPSLCIFTIRPELKGKRPSAFSAVHLNKRPTARYITVSPSGPACRTGRGSSRAATGPLPSPEAQLRARGRGGDAELGRATGTRRGHAKEGWGHGASHTRLPGTAARR